MHAVGFLSHDIAVSEVGTDEPIVIVVPRDDVAIFAARIGESIALCSNTGTGRQVVGISTLRALSAAGDSGDSMQAIYIQHRWLREPVGVDTIAARLEHNATISNTAFEEVTPYDPAAFGGFAEELNDFDRGTDLETKKRLYDTVLLNYGYRCAITGAAFKGTGRANNELDVVALRSPDSGGEYHSNNYLAVTTAVKSAFNIGVLTLSDDLGIIVDLARCPADLRLLLNSDGRCRRPAVEASALLHANIIWHRRQSLGLA